MPPSALERSDRQISEHIEAILRRHGRRYGRCRIWRGQADQPSLNLLAGKEQLERSDRVWAGEITFISAAAGWFCLAVVIDLCGPHRRPVAGRPQARRIGLPRLQTGVGNAPSQGRHVFHSDRGSRYGSGEFRTMLAQSGVFQSRSARANPDQNAWTESFMGTFQAGRLQGGGVAHRHDARTEIFDFIETCYHTRRKHFSLADHFSSHPLP